MRNDVWKNPVTWVLLMLNFAGITFVSLVLLRECS